MKADLRLMLVTDPVMCRRRGLAETVLAAIEGGVTIVQLRDKEIGDADLTTIAMDLHVLLKPLGIPLIVNDRPKVAHAAGLDGVHIGQEDGDPGAARDLLGPEALIGLSVTSAEELRTVDPQVVDYVGLGPLFATGTKPDAAPALGLEGFAVLRKALPLPVVAIGGIDAGNAAAIGAAGADGIACVSAICAANDPSAAAAELRRAMAEAKAA